jgi:hypothetical protein
MMIARRLATLAALIALLGIALMSVSAQEDNGQFCVRGFEDRNANGVRDAGEPLLTRGIGANLQDANGVVIGSALLDNSPTSGQGVICFPQLPAGQYTMVVTSAEFAPTLSNNMTVTIAGDGLPTVFDYAGQRAIVADVTATTDDTVDEQKAVERIAIAMGGAAITMLIVAVIGLFLYTLFLRGNKRQAYPGYPPDYYYQRPPTSPTRDTATMRSVQNPPQTGSRPMTPVEYPPSTDTGEYPEYPTDDD